MAFSQQAKASVLILLAGTGWGFLGLFFNILSQVGCTPEQVSLFRMGGGSVFLGTYLGLFRRDLLVVRSWKSLALFFVLGAGCLNFLNIFLFNAMRVSSVAVAAVLLYTAPLFVLGMSVLFFKEQLTRRKVFSILLSVIGCALVSGIVGSGASISFIAFLLGMGASVAYASYSILNRLAVEKNPPLTITFYSFLFCALAMLPFANVGSLVHLSFSWPAVFAVLALGLFSASLPYFLYSIALQYVYPSHAAVLATIEPIVAALTSFFILHEHLGGWQLLGMGCILSGVIVLTLAPAVPAVKSKPIDSV